MIFLDVIEVLHRCARGAAWLDVHKPRWWDDCDPDALDMADSSVCVIGQTFGDYTSADFTEYEGDATTGESLGFEATTPYTSREALAREYNLLRDVWAAIITVRRAESPPLQTWRVSFDIDVDASSTTSLLGSSLREAIGRGEGRYYHAESV